MRLSLCIATYNRAAFIGQTLDAILAQLAPEVEIVVVDGASSDATPEVMARYADAHPAIVYRRESSNSGVDADFDKAVGYAQGRYCWLMSDDDVIVPGAVETVLRELRAEPQLLIVNAEIRDRDLRVLLKKRQLDADFDRDYTAAEHEQLFAQAGSYLSFIGGVIVDRAWWLARDREVFYGSLFIHVGVIFQRPAPQRTRVLARPLVRIRYGNAQWSARGFDIWMLQWPRLAWGFPHFSAEAKARVTPRYPAESLRTLLWYRALGAWGPVDLPRLRAGGASVHPMAGLAARMPIRLLNAALALYCRWSRDDDAPVKLYDLGRSEFASSAARWLARRSLSPGTER